MSMTMDYMEYLEYGEFAKKHLGPIVDVNVLYPICTFLD